MNAVFTIVAKNYLPYARTLGDSLAKIHPTMPFHIILADDTEGLIDLAKEPYDAVEASQLGIPQFSEMAFKYDLIEFATALKPFIFEQLFGRYGYDNLIYLDPDIFVYSSLQPVFAELEGNLMILTPHVLKATERDLGTKPLNDFLQCGVFNLGFLALSNCGRTSEFLDWWKARLSRQGFIDFADGLFTDQKWMDLMPCYYGSAAVISRHPGLNLAHWNIHERSLSVTEDGYTVDGQPLVFFHFSGFNPQHPDIVSRPHARPVLKLSDIPEYRPLFACYTEVLLSNRSPEAPGSYAYSRFRNGAPIFALYRRLYRTLTENGLEFDDPFSAEVDSYFALLARNRLIISSKQAPGEFRGTDVPDAGKKLAMLKLGLRMAKKTLGIKYYHLLLRVLYTLARPEEQVFLLESLKLDLPVRFRA